MTLRSTILSATALLAFTAPPAAATVNKTWVSSTGTDSGTCQLVAPCKTFQFAHDQTTPGGEIDVKDTGSYGQVVITKAISIVSGDGALAAVGVPSGGVGITVNAGATDKVVLEGLYIDGHGVGNDGVSFAAGSSLTVENCHVRNVLFKGIDMANSAYSMRVSNTEVSGAKDTGIYMAVLGGIARSSISNVDIHDNGVGIFVGHDTQVAINGSTVSNNTTGISTKDGSFAVGGSTIMNNEGYGLIAQNGYAYSFRNNHIYYNDTFGVVNIPLQ